MVAPPAKRPRVLLAEDDRDLRVMLERMLGTFADVQSFEDGMAAYQALKDGARPDVIVTDMMMPRLDGLGLMRRVKADADLARIPIIVLTAKGSPKDVIAGINSGARHYLTKPFKSDELIDKVKKVLRVA